MNKFLNFLLYTAPPHVAHQLNALESIGNTFLSPFSHTDENASIRLTAPQRIKECYDQIKIMQQVFI